MTSKTIIYFYLAVATLLVQLPSLSFAASIKDLQSQGAISVKRLVRKTLRSAAPVDSLAKQSMGSEPVRESPKLVAKPLVVGKSINVATFVHKHLASAEKKPVDVMVVKENKEELERLQITIQSGAVHFEPAALRADQVAKRWEVSLKYDGVGAEALMPQLFVRDEKILRYDADAKQLVAQAEGKSELFLVYDGKIHILPVVVGHSPLHHAVPTEQVPQVEDKDKKTTVNPKQLWAHYDAKHNKAVVHIDAPPEAMETDKPDFSSEDEQSEAKAASKNVQPTGPTPVATNDSAFSRPQEMLSFARVILQFVDDRSGLVTKKLFPLPGLAIKLVGTEIRMLSDERGYVVLNDIPQGSRFVLDVQDPQGRVRASIVELSTESGKDEIRKFVVMARDQVLSAFEQVTATTRDMHKSSACLNVMNERRLRQGQSFYQVLVDTDADRLAYVDAFGFLNLNQTSTAENGRACVFNLAPGPTTASIHDQSGQKVGSVTFAAYSGKHAEIDVFLDEEVMIDLALGVSANAGAHLGADVIAANSLTQIDGAPLYAFGEQNTLDQLAKGVVGTTSPLIASNERKYVLSQASEFEDMIYAIDEDTPVSKRIAPLFLRGFIEDMASVAKVAFDPEAGTVVFEYGHQNGQMDTRLNVKLIDENAREVGIGWLFNDVPITKAIFFNVPVGNYTIMVESSDGSWIASQTVSVYSQTGFYSCAGSCLTRVQTQSLTSLNP